jgi:hypothetical protein
MTQEDPTGTSAQSFETPDKEEEAMPPTRPTQEELIKRETAIAEKATKAEKARAMVEGDIPDPRAAQFAIRADRYKRWEEYVDALKVPDELQAWAKAMATQYESDTCAVWANRVPWITALLIVIYGEAEYFWPLELGKSEIQRAEDWMIGRRPPNGVPANFGGKIRLRAITTVEQEG